MYSKTKSSIFKLLTIRMYASPSIVILFDFIESKLHPAQTPQCQMQDLVRVGGGVPTNLQLVLNSLHIHVHHYGKVQEVNDLESSGKTWTTWIIAGNRTDIINVDDPENHFTWTDRFLITKFTVNKITNSKSTLTLEKSENLQQT